MLKGGWIMFNLSCSVPAMPPAEKEQRKEEL